MREGKGAVYGYGKQQVEDWKSLKEDSSRTWQTIE